MTKYRVHGPDVLQTRPPKKITPGTVPANKVPIYDHKGRPRGQVGPLATSATVSRFTGTLSNTLGKKDGRAAWIGAAPSKPSVAQRQAIELRKSLRTAKGSNSK